MGDDPIRYRTGGPFSGKLRRVTVAAGSPRCRCNGMADNIMADNGVMADNGTPTTRPHPHGRLSDT